MSFSVVPHIKQTLNRVNQFIVGILMIMLILDVWIGVLDRYVFQWQLVWVEELARYIMIWAILMAVPCCTAGREHMGLEFVVRRFPQPIQTLIKRTLGLLTCLFFFYIAYLGYFFAMKGANQLSTVFALPMSYAYAAVPVTFALSGFQALLVWIEDCAGLTPPANQITAQEETPC
ncbi:TRAP transporter small permease [Vibrio nigripulchritudo]|uniref:TRAP transporter small permease n=1 Tax=Vibrio nigripulchritudo TaxID=28173 RepID=UPI0003B2212C|nr:TRAP transporter small permease [Vibrio nigripulchritudo]CCN73143.1 putative TRAP-type C4-dicarboxylate transport system, small permease component [Vibrio nigripulchritudo SFn118]